MPDQAPETVAPPPEGQAAPPDASDRHAKEIFRFASALSLTKRDRQAAVTVAQNVSVFAGQQVSFFRAAGLLDDPDDVTQSAVAIALKICQARTDVALRSCNCRCCVAERDRRTSRRSRWRMALRSALLKLERALA